MRFFIGPREIVVSAVIAVAVAMLLDLESALGAALGAVLVPFVALATSSRVPDREAGGEPVVTRLPGVCHCGHVMSMHCHPDCSGPCAAPNCPCEGTGG